MPVRLNADLRQGGGGQDVATHEFAGGAGADLLVEHVGLAVGGLGEDEAEAAAVAEHQTAEGGDDGLGVTLAAELGGRVDEVDAAAVGRGGDPGGHGDGGGILPEEEGATGDEGLPDVVEGSFLIVGFACKTLEPRLEEGVIGGGGDFHAPVRGGG